MWRKDDDEKIVRAVDGPTGSIIFQRVVVLQDNRFRGRVEFEIRNVKREKHHRDKYQPQCHDRPINNERSIQSEHECTHNVSPSGVPVPDRRNSLG